MTVANYTPIDDLVKKQTDDKRTGLPKEVEPFRLSENVAIPESTEIQEVVEHTVSDEEVAQHVEVRKDNIDVVPDLKVTGVQPITSTQFPSYQDIKLPISDDKVVAGLKSPINTSIRWLATYAAYLLWQAHLQLKVVHGKVVRVIQKS